MSSLTAILGVMNAGKSTALLQRRHETMEHGGRVLVLTSSVDDRAGWGVVSSRIGLSCEAMVVMADTNIRALVEAEHRDDPIAEVLVDEVQFMEPSHIRQLASVADDLDIPVRAYGLRVNAFGTLFGPAVELLLAWADEVHDLPARCHCGAKATLILRYKPTGEVERTGDLVEVAAEGRYVSVCRRHYAEGDIGPMNRARCEASAQPLHPSADNDVDQSRGVPRTGSRPLPASVQMTGIGG